LDNDVIRQWQHLTALTALFEACNLAGCATSLQSSQNLIPCHDGEGEVAKVGQVSARVVMDPGINPFHDFGQRIGVEEGWLHGGLGLLPHETAPIQGNRLNLCDLLVRTAFIHLMPGLERLRWAFYRLMDGDPHTLMLGEVQRL
jgi:hypothetical protein